MKDFENLYGTVFKITYGFKRLNAEFWMHKADWETVPDKEFLEILREN